jgi:hypothetical protein
MKQKDNKIQEGANSLFNGSQPGEQETERIRSQRKFFLTGRRCKAPQEGNKEEIRTSFMLNRKQYDKVREIAMREGITIKDLVYSMLELAIEKYERKHGQVVVSKEDKAKNIFK